MAVAQGYGKTSSSGLVFAYDAADMVNSFKGKPGTNILVGVLRNYDGYSITNYSNGKLFETNGYTEVVNIPTLGTTTVESIEIYNVYSGYGNDGNYNCCPTLFHYSTSWRSTILQGNTNYTYEIVYKCDSGYTHPNYMYHYEYRADGTYNTEFGVHDNSRRTELGDGWYHAWGSFTTQATTADGYFGCWYYNYNTKDKLSIAKISLQEGLSVLPPKQLITPNTSRSVTQSLYDLTGGSELTVACSFKNNGEMTFDGTDDKIDINRNNIISGTGAFTIEAVINNISGTGVIIGNYGPSYTSNSIWFFAGGMYLNGGYGYMDNHGAIMNGLHHLVCIREADGTFKTYQDSIIRKNTNPGSLASVRSDINWRVGVDVNSTNAEPFNGDIHIIKVYNRALTEAEILQNYRHYKSRYNL